MPANLMIMHRAKQVEQDAPGARGGKVFHGGEGHLSVQCAPG